MSLRGRKRVYTGREEFKVACPLEGFVGRHAVGLMIGFFLIVKCFH